MHKTNELQYSLKISLLLHLPSIVYYLELKRSDLEWDFCRYLIHSFIIGYLSEHISVVRKFSKTLSTITLKTKHGVNKNTFILENSGNIKHFVSVHVPNKSTLSNGTWKQCIRKTMHTLVNTNYVSKVLLFRACLSLLLILHLILRHLYKLSIHFVHCL